MQNCIQNCLGLFYGETLFLLLFCWARCRRRQWAGTSCWGPRNRHLPIAFTYRLRLATFQSHTVSPLQAQKR